MRYFAILLWLGSGVFAPALGQFKIYVDQLNPPVLQRVNYGYDVEAVCTGDGTTPCDEDDDCEANGVCGVLVDALAPGTQTTIWDLVCDPDGAGTCRAAAWDFSGVTPANFPGIVEVGSTVVPIDATESCSHDKCGFTQAGAVLGREDRNFDQSLGGFFCDDGTTSCALDAECVGIGTGLCRRTGLCDDGTTVCNPKICDDGTTTCIDNADCAGIGTGTCNDDCSGIGSGKCNILNVTLNVTEREDGVKVCSDGSSCVDNSDCGGGDTCDEGANIWLRAAIRNELETGSLGEGESRLCYVGDGRSEVPLYRFENQDDNGFSMQPGDEWIARFDCEQTIFNHQCGDDCDALTCMIALAGCTGSCGVGPSQDFEAMQQSKVVNQGKLTLPSGHVFDALVVQQNAEFCAYSSSFACFFFPTPVRTVLYLWLVPEIGTVVRLMSTQLACDTENFEVLAETDIKFGLFPPRSINVTNTTETTVELSWDPGSITDRIDGYRVHWDTSSGTDGYAYDSVNNPGQVSITGTTATVSGLCPDTEYFFTVTAVSEYTDPGTCIFDVCETTTYESLLFPKQVTGGTTPIPQEVSATTTGGSGVAGAVPDGDDVPGPQLTVDKNGDGTIDLDWADSCLACDSDYGIYEGTLGDFSTHDQVVCTTGGETGATLDPADRGRYYLVVPQNGGVEGSYGTDGGGEQRPVSNTPCLGQSIGDPVCL